MAVTLAWFDALLVAVLLMVAAFAIYGQGARQAVLFFIVLGLVLAVIWARLGAADVAIAEAAIGAGLTGALLLLALRGDDADPRAATMAGSGGRLVPWINGALVVAFAITLAWALAQQLALPRPDELAQEAKGQLAAAGVSNPVTAVLLNFRAYDTLLEMVVLFAAVLGIIASGVPRMPFRPAGQLLANLVGWGVPLLILVAVYLLWIGASAPGGAFQAGAVLAACGVLLYLGGQAAAGLPAGALLRALSVAGIAAFLLVGWSTLAWHGDFLAYRGAVAGLLIVVIELFAMVSIALALVVAYLGSAPQAWYGRDDGGSQT
jgi:multisubunit Na+/H+ antiporter MnhB subunit